MIIELHVYATMYRYVCELIYVIYVSIYYVIVLYIIFLYYHNYNYYVYVRMYVDTYILTQ